MITDINTKQQIKTQSKIKAKGIRIKWSESSAESIQGSCIDGGRGDLLSWSQVDTMLRIAATTAPNNGAYNKTAFIIEFEDGDTYEGRLDLMHCHKFATGNIIGSHVLSFLTYYSGLNGAPSWMVEDHGQLKADEIYKNQIKGHEQESIDYLEKYEILGDWEELAKLERIQRREEEKREKAKQKQDTENRLELSRINRELSKNALAELMRIKPEGVNALIIAELIEDNSDMQTDYHGSKVVRTVALDWKKKTRTCFKAMKRAATKFKPTNELNAENGKYENRENYSMGGGNYLKAEYRHNCGWKITIMDLTYGNISTSSPIEILDHLK